MKDEARSVQPEVCGLKPGVSNTLAIVLGLLLAACGAAGGLASDWLLGSALALLGVAVFMAGLWPGGSELDAGVRVPAAAFTFILLWLPVCLLPWPAWLIANVSPFRCGVLGDKAAAPLFFSGQDAIVWLACAWGAVGAFVCGARLARSAPFRYFTAALVAGGTLVAAVALVLYGFGVPLDFGVPHAGNIRLRGPLPNPDRFACWLAMLLFLGIGACLSARGLAAAAAGSAVAVLFAALVLTGSRGGLLALLLLLPLLAVSLRRWRRFAPYAVPLLVVTGVLAAAGVWALAGRLLRLPAEVQRIEVWKSALPLVRDFGGVGAGPGAFGRVYAWYQPINVTGRYLHAHNEALELAIELGVPGVLLVCALVYWLVRVVVYAVSGRLSRREPMTAALTAAVLAPVFQSIFDFPLRQRSTLLLWFALLGVLAGRLAAYRAQECWRPETGDWRQKTRESGTGSDYGLRPVACSLPRSACFPVAALLMLCGPLIAAAGLCGAGDDEDGALRAARLLAPGERYIASAQQGAYQRLVHGELPAERFRFINRLALERAGDDAFVLYRAGAAALLLAEPLEADRLMLLSSRAGPAYRDLNRAVAGYFWQRYRLAGGRYGSFFRLLREVLERLPGEELTWVERFLRDGIPEAVCRRLAGDARVFEYGRLLARLGRGEEALARLEEAIAWGDARALPYAAGLLLKAGKRPRSLEYWQRALAASGVPVTCFVEAATWLDIRDAEFIRPLLPAVASKPGTLRWFVKRIWPLDAQQAFLSAWLLVQSSGQPSDIALYVRAAAGAGESEAAWRALASGLERQRDAGVLWECMPTLLRGLPAAEVLSRLAALDTTAAPAAVLADVSGICLQKGLAREAVMLGEAGLAKGYCTAGLLNTLAAAYRQLGLHTAAALVEEGKRKE